jgi:uncharacterized protein YjbI with pentapeptide repeats
MAADQKKRNISESELDHLIQQISKVKAVKEIQIKGRSLLNRNSEGKYRFSHYSVQEFLVAKFLLEKPVFKPKEPILITDFIFRMLGLSPKAPNFRELLDCKALNFSVIDMKKLNFSGMNFCCTDFSDAVMEDCVFQSTNLEGSRFSKAKLKGAQFDIKAFDEAYFEDA